MSCHMFQGLGLGRAKISSSLHSSYCLMGHLPNIESLLGSCSPRSGCRNKLAQGDCNLLRVSSFQPWERSSSSALHSPLSDVTSCDFILGCRGQTLLQIHQASLWGAMMSFSFA